MGLAVGPGAKVQDAPMAQGVEVFRSDLHAPMIIHRNIVLRIILHVLADEHRRYLAGQGVQGLVGFVPHGDHDDPIHLAADQKGEDLLLQVVIVRGVADHQIIAPGTSIYLQVGRELAHKGVVETWDDESHDFGMPFDHGTSHRVGGIPHLLAQLQDASAGLFTDLGTPRKGAGDRGVGNAGHFCDVF